MDGDEDNAGNERVSGDENGDGALNWEAVYSASEVGEPRTYTRQRTKKRKEAPSSAGAASKTKKGLASASSSKKGKETVVDVEDDPVLEESEEVKDSDFEDSEVEEVEGYASLSLTMRMNPVFRLKDTTTPSSVLY
ncbi:hypothetical protein SESBI_45408 [Sesbania bispinosa]|nr:hypothetical protein SESBI_45408 [Sesbania bispinosa]